MVFSSYINSIVLFLVIFHIIKIWFNHHIMGNYKGVITEESKGNKELNI